MLDLAELDELAALDRPELKDDPGFRSRGRALARSTTDELFAEIRAGDLLVHHPYDSFAASVRVVRAHGRGRPET